MFLLWEENHTVPLTAVLDLPASHPYSQLIRHVHVLMAKQKEERKKSSVSSVATTNGAASYIF